MKKLCSDFCMEARNKKKKLINFLSHNSDCYFLQYCVYTPQIFFLIFFF